MSEKSPLREKYEKINTVFLGLEGVAVLATAMFPPLMVLHAPAVLALAGDAAGSAIIDAQMKDYDRSKKTGKSWMFGLNPANAKHAT